jgi:hypothetical protein
MKPAAKFSNPPAIRDLVKSAQRALIVPARGFDGKAAEARRACELLEEAARACLRAGIAEAIEGKGFVADLDAIRAKIRQEAEGLEGFARAGLADTDTETEKRA